MRRAAHRERVDENLSLTRWHIGQSYARRTGVLGLAAYPMAPDRISRVRSEWPFTTEAPPSPGSVVLPAAAVPDCAVFIVGCPRSGTTLLRLMLDSHPSLAIPDESHFIVELHDPARKAASTQRREEVLERVFGHERFERWNFDPAEVRRLATTTQPPTYSDVIGTVFGAYAAAHGKPRWGDKSPPYVRHIPLLAELFPQARFIHIIRDGREVATSLAAHEWGPPTPAAAAVVWQRHVRAGRRAGQQLPGDRYLELRLENLIAEPERVLREACQFLDEPFAPEMLDYHRTASERVWTGGAGDPKGVDHSNVRLPPTPGLRDWRAGLSVAEHEAVEAAAQPLLGELGYAAELFATPGDEASPAQTR